MKDKKIEKIRLDIREEVRCRPWSEKTNRKLIVFQLDGVFGGNVDRPTH